MTSSTRVSPLSRRTEPPFLFELLDALPVAVGIVRDHELAYSNRELTALMEKLDDSEAARPSDWLARATWDDPGVSRRGRVKLALATGTDEFEIVVSEIGLEGRAATALCLRPIDSGEPRTHSTQAARLASLGRLAAGIAHEINNPLAYLLGSLQYLERELGCPEKVGGNPALDQSIVSAIANAREGAERVRSIARDLMTFARPVAESKQLVDVEAVLDSMVNLAWNEIRHRARLVKRYARVPAVRGDQSRLGQVFLNLIVNAAQAIDAAGRLEGAITLSTALDGDRVVVEVQDTGSGITEDSLPHVFEPFFTTKPFEKGSGLGLSICQSIVASHGGRIDVESGVGVGATFRVSLPIAEAPLAPAPAARPSDDDTSAARARILVIDDEPLLGQTLSLAFAGRHEIVLATSGREALRRLERDRNFDLVLCDLMMPDISGTQVFAEVEHSYPELVERFAFMTGGAFTERSQEFLERYAGHRVDKPFTMSEVEALLNEIRRARKLD